jgi:hypothetical protein
LKKKYDIDHSMPFSRWPNNDLWNLLPTDSQINNQKSDRLPTEHKLKASKERMQHWWQEAWLNDPVATNKKINISSSKTLEINEQPMGYTISTPYFANSTEIEQKTETLPIQQKRFFAEANIALPGLNVDNTSIDDLFEALVMQRGRLKEMQQLRDW